MVPLRIRAERSEIEQLCSEKFSSMEVQWVLFFTDCLSGFILVDSNGLRLSFTLRLLGSQNEGYWILWYIGIKMWWFCYKWFLLVMFSHWKVYVSYGGMSLVISVYLGFQRFTSSSEWGLKTIWNWCWKLCRKGFMHTNQYFIKLFYNEIHYMTFYKVI